MGRSARAGCLGREGPGWARAEEGVHPSPRGGSAAACVGKGSWAQHGAVPSTWHLPGRAVVPAGGIKPPHRAQAGAVPAGDAASHPGWQQQRWPGPHGRASPAAPWGQAWVGAGAPQGGMWAGRGRGSSTGTHATATTPPAAATQHGRETPNPALRQGEGGVMGAWGAQAGGHLWVPPRHCRAGVAQLPLPSAVPR